MATKRPLCNYSGVIKELASSDSLVGVSSGFPYWKIDSGETVSVGERQEYAIASGTLVNNGIIEMGAESILIVRV